MAARELACVSVCVRWIPWAELILGKEGSEKKNDNSRQRLHSWGAHYGGYQSPFDGACRRFGGRGAVCISQTHGGTTLCVV